MAKNNHLSRNFRELSTLLSPSSLNFHSPDAAETHLIDYARTMASVENVIAVLSDMATGSSLIFSGAFAHIIGLTDYTAENSIWEKRLLDRMPAEEQNAKFLAELRFHHFVHTKVKNRSHYYMMSTLRMADSTGQLIDVLHRMFYLYSPSTGHLRHALCLYGPVSFNLPAKSVVVNSLTGAVEPLSADGDSSLLTLRQRQILALIDSGLRTADIARQLCISSHTVSRHRQEIIRQLRVANTIEACSIARSLHLI